MKLYEIQFGYENCETITIPGHFVYYINYKEGPITVKSANPGNSPLSIDKCLDYFVIGIFSEVNSDLCKASGDCIEDYRGPNKHCLLTERLGSDNLCSVDIMTWDGFDINSIKHNYYDLPWVGENEYTNEGISTWTNVFGDIIIGVSEESKKDPKFMFKYFSEEYFNDRVYMQYLKEECNVIWIDKEEQREK